MTAVLLEELYELIRSLSKSEKRYFNLYSKFQTGDKRYLSLFRILDSHKTFNEKTISRKFAAKNSSANFPAVKKYLFDQLVASLKSYGAYKDLDSDHTDLIETYKVLHYKGLYGQSERLLKKVKQFTFEDDAYTRHFSVLFMEYMKEMFNPLSTGTDKVIKILAERRKTLDIMDNYLWVGEIFTLVRLHLRKKLYCRNNRDKQELTKIIEPLLKTTEEDMLSRTALGTRNIALCDYYLAIGQPKKAFETSKSYLRLRKTAGTNDKLDFQTLNESFQHIVICLRSGYFDGFEELAKEYKTLLDTIRNKEKYFMAYERWFNNVFIYYHRMGRFEEGNSFLEKEEKARGPLEKNFSMKAKLALWYSSAYNLYARRQFKRSLQFIQRIMNQPDSDIEEIIFAKFLMMFIHYDLKNYELLEYQVRSAHRMMEKKERLYQCEKLLLDFFKSVAETDSPKQRQLQLALLAKQVAQLFKTFYERGFSFYFDIESWIESRMKDKDFTTTVQAKAKIASGS